MDIYELFEKHYNELTEKAIFVIENTCPQGAKDIGTFETAEQFNKFVAEYFPESCD